MISSSNKTHRGHDERSVKPTRLGPEESHGAAAVAKWAWTELDATAGPSNEPRSRGGSSRASDQDEMEAAYRQGVQDGRDAMQETVWHELELANSAAMSAVEQVRRNAEAWTARLQENLVALAVGIARQIIEREIEQDPEIFQDLARAAVAAFPVEEPVQVRLHPDDLDLLVSGGRADASTITVGDRTVPFVSDPEMGRGGCVVEGPVKIVDGRVDRALQRVYRTLTDG